MARKVAGDTMVGAVEESVRPRMKGRDLPSLVKFSSILSDGLKDGGAKNDMIFSFENSCNQKLTVVIDGKTKGEVKSPILCRAFTSTYLGPDTVSPPLKEMVAKTIIGWKSSNTFK
eukprot:CAMPEP_0119033338 /NCGR_PEP_ID=MMETSP1177-20130426/387_1 /TAXON_ID=2985 /ORGANISM="Ochromonas sp, Strain CCMP1899" /LENGTH=115 /DNA_ID=CAMNT_0006990015 /DNA_START=495 /DNA_END=842 /DNA_ORIENTATION=+